MFRLIDSTNNIPDNVIKAVLSNFAFRRVEQVNGVSRFFIAEGFAIFYILSSGKDIHDVRRLRLVSQLTSGSHQKFIR